MDLEIHSRFKDQQFHRQLVSEIRTMTRSRSLGTNFSSIAHIHLFWITTTSRPPHRMSSGLPWGAERNGNDLQSGALIPHDFSLETLKCFLLLLHQIIKCLFYRNISTLQRAAQRRHRQSGPLRVTCLIYLITPAQWFWGLCNSWPYAGGINALEKQERIIVIKLSGASLFRHEHPNTWKVLGKSPPAARYKRTNVALPKCPMSGHVTFWSLCLQRPGEQICTSPGHVHTRLLLNL